MPANNFIDTRPIRTYARRLCVRITEPPARERFSRVAYDQLHADPRNGRPLTRGELANAPEWALRAWLLGRPVHMFVADPDAVAPIRHTARALRETCREAAFLATAPTPSLSPHARVVRTLLWEFLAKIERMSFCDITGKAVYFKTERKRRLDLAKIEEVRFARDELYTAPGRSWRRIVSVRELSDVGDELWICLRRGSPQHNRYARRLCADTARFWVLRDHSGAALMVAMLDAEAGCVREVRGLRNAPIAPDNSDLAILSETRGG